MRVHNLPPVPRDEDTRPPEQTPRVKSSLEARNNRLHVSPFLFTLCWWFLVSMHFFNGTLALAFSAIYLFFSLPAVYPTTSMLEVPLQLLRISGWSYAALSMIHWYSLACLLRWSIKRKSLTFTAPSTTLDASRESLSSVGLVRVRLNALYRWCWGPWNRLLGIDGIFGMNGKYFHAVFFTREALEIGLQTYQANQLSRAVRRRWITDLAVVTVVLNAISSPLIWLVLRKRPESVRRIASITADMCLDFCGAAVIPLCVVYPFITGYDASTGLLPIVLLYDDTWFISSVAEIRQFCVTSAADFLATMMPHVTVLTCLTGIKKLVQRHANEVATSEPKMKRFLKRIVAATRMSAKVTVPTTPERDLDTRSFAHLESQRWFPAVLARRLLKWYYVCVVMWALGVVGIHMQSSIHAQSSSVVGCRLTVNAWLTKEVPCSVMQINCYRDRIRGSALEIAMKVAPLDRSLLKKIIFTHCPALEIPAVLGEFNAVSEMDVFNSTLLTWSQEAAVTPATLSSLINFNWFGCPYVTFPVGFLHSDLPKSFSRFVISKSNITELPDELGTLWANHPLDHFSVQLSNLRRLPSTFRNLRITKLRLISNKLTEIADNALRDQALRVLHLSGNPISAWPSSIGDTSGLMELFAEHTLLSRLSPQVNDWWAAGVHTGLRPIIMSLFGSPICQSGSTDACRVDSGNSGGTYRWDLIEVHRALDL